MAACEHCDNIVESEHMDCDVCEGELCSVCCDKAEDAWIAYEEKEVKEDAQ